MSSLFSHTIRLSALLIVVSLLADVQTATAGRPATSAQPASIFSVASSGSRELLVDVRPAAYPETMMPVDGAPMRLISAPGAGSTDEPGKPGMPVEGFLAAVPPGTKPVVEIVSSQFDVTVSDPIVPAPSFSLTAEGESVPEYHVDKAFYDTHNAFYPPVAANAEETARLRDLNVVKIHVYPLQYNPAAKQLKKYTALRLRVRFVPVDGAQPQMLLPVNGPDPEFDQLYTNMVLNYRDAASWRTVDAREVAATDADPAASWFQTGRTYYRIPVIADGMYKIPYATLLSYGIDLAAADNASAALYFKGASQPMRVVIDTVVASSFIEFYAQRNRGSNSFFNRYSDTSAYWLTWNDANPLRLGSGVSAGAAADTALWYTEKLWSEQDANYFFGVTQDDLLTTDDVQGEGWYWTDLVSGQSRTLRFTLDSLQRKTNVPVQLRIKMNGMTVCNGSGCTVPSRHEASLYINRVLVGVVDFTQNNETTYTCTFPDSLLRKGADTLRVDSKAWDAAANNISKFYVDWFELTYPRPLLGVNGSLKFTVQPSVPGVAGKRAFKINSVPADSANIYDLTNSRRITGLSKQSTNLFIFSDTISAARTYLVVKERAKLAPSTLIPKQFRNIRSNQGGTDYLVISHANFRADADRLAAFRSSTNKLRTAVVDVQDIYDEFNYGHLDPLALRSFLKYAYYNWRKPAPAYAVFFGDATWDFKRNISSSVKLNYVPSYGNPPSDNALVSFDSTMSYMPFMLAGRIPVSTPAEAQSVVNKIIGYEHPPDGDWNRSYLFITDGNTSSEKYAFNFYSDGLIDSYVTPSPVGGTVTKVYKATDAIIDGENKPYLQQKFADGLVMVHFMGHSGGRIWGVDIGSPNQLQNTNGMLPFVASVSCNVGFFSDPRSNVLSEDFLLADNRGAIAVWSASSLGYSTVGRILVDKFLSQAANDYSRNIGLMTSIARINFWLLNNKYATPLIIQSMNLHPLIGDPYTHLAMPVKPDFEVTNSGIVLVNNPPIADSILTLKVAVKNNGLAAKSPVTVSLRDSYTDENGHTAAAADLIPPFQIADFTGVDSFTVAWNPQGKSGTHAVTVTLDPADSIPETDEINNTATASFYVYRNTIHALTPLPQTLVQTRTPLLTATVPSGQDTSAIRFAFEADTSLSFNSPLKVSSGAVVPDAASASWRTPLLEAGQIYYWRAQASTTNGTGLKGAWANSAFTQSPAPVPADSAYWKQTGKLFLSNTVTGTSVTDSGATMLRSDSTSLYARSLGFRANSNTDFYSVLQINSTIAYGLWWDDPYSFLVGWYNPSNGAYQLKGYNFLRSGDTEKMRDILAGIPNGNYVLLSAVWDARQNLTDTLIHLIKNLGSVKIDSLQRGQSWILISQKGVQAPIVEKYLAAANVEATVKVPNFFRLGNAQLLTAPIGPAYRWGRASWDVTLPGINTTDTVRVLGVRKNGTGSDTLMTVTNGSGSIDLSGIGTQSYPTLRLSGSLASTDGLTSPLLRQWTVAYLPPSDLAISPWSVKMPSSIANNANFQISMDIANLGLRTSKNIWITATFLDDTTQRAGALLDTLAPGGSRHVDLTMSVTGANGPHAIAVTMEQRTTDGELLSDNNTVIKPFTLTDSPSASAVRVFFDNVELRDGDFVSPRPSISIEYPPSASAKNVQKYSLAIDGKEIRNDARTGETPASAAAAKLADPLPDGAHTLELRTVSASNTVSASPVKSVTFQVASAASFRNLFNYPNPFSGQTFFNFALTGIRVPEYLTVKVYTVAGRLIKTIHVDGSRLQIGLNTIPWDGRDDQGDEIANGNYLFRIATGGNSESAEAVQRIVKLK